jgi:hypothetical protein
MKRSNTSEDDLRAEGGKTKHRYAKGGKVPKVKINIHGGPHLHMHGIGGGMGPGTMGGPPMAPAGAMVGAPPSPGGLPTAGMLPGQPPMRARGGHVMSEHVPEDISSYRPAKAHKARAGAFSGVGRLEMYEKMKHREG